nr:NAD(P)/FAD-dependent oxidoreductase [Flavobacterium sp.]
MKQDSIVIVGGGLAGLIAAIHLKNNNYDVIVIEKNEFPKHKVCGEYISNEVLPYLKSLGLDIPSLGPKHIDKLFFSVVSGKSLNSTLPLGGFGISRYQLDQYLYKEALSRGCQILKETVSDIEFLDSKFKITTNLHTYTAPIVVGAFGKRSNLDIKFKRPFIQKKSHWLGVKAHYRADFPDDLVGLHHFAGGYCGVSKVEGNLVNICYLANYETFKLHKTIEEYQENVVCKNPNLKDIFKKAVIQFEKPLTISQVSFEKKKCVENHILMIGDTAGLIHPLCGNGMAMAIHSAKLAAENILLFLEKNIDRDTLESKYSKDWNKNFKKRLQMGRILGQLLQYENTAQAVLKILILFPALLPIIIKKTHGKPI